jgi:hypothetical protein
LAGDWRGVGPRGFGGCAGARLRRGLKYWGWINPSVWPTAEEINWRESIGQGGNYPSWFDEQAAGKDYFVVTLLDDLDRQPELKSLLYQRYVVMKQSPDYLIFELR